MHFTCGSIDIEKHKIYMRDVMKSYVREIVEKDIKYTHEICYELNPEWTKTFKRRLTYKTDLVDFIMSYYDKVDLKQYV